MWWEVNSHSGISCTCTWWAFPSFYQSFFLLCGIMALCCPSATCEHLGKYFCWIGSNFPVLQNSKRTSHSGINCTELTSWLRMMVIEGVCMYVSWGFAIFNFSPSSWVIKKVKGRSNSIFLTGSQVKGVFSEMLVQRTNTHLLNLSSKISDSAEAVCHA